jgi:hypothetical protein
MLGLSHRVARISGNIPAHKPPAKRFRPATLQPPPLDAEQLRVPLPYRSAVIRRRIEHFIQARHEAPGVTNPRTGSLSWGRGPGDRGMCDVRVAVRSPRLVRMQFDGSTRTSTVARRIEATERLLEHGAQTCGTSLQGLSFLGTANSILPRPRTAGHARAGARCEHCRPMRSRAERDLRG